MNFIRNTMRGVLAIGLAALFAAGTQAQVVPVVSSASPISRLHVDQLADIFLGKIERLPDGTRVVPVDGPENAPDREAFYRRFLGRTPVQIRAYWSKLLFTGRGFPPREVLGHDALKALLRENPAFIGYMDAAAVDASVKMVEVLQ